MRKQLIVAAVAVALVGGQLAVNMYYSEAMAQQATGPAGQLSPPEAAQVAERMGKTLEQAVREGLMTRLENGNYVVNESGAALLAAWGADVGGFAGLTPSQITALVAAALSL
ncbi:MAG: hypothetical protein AB1651_17295, partial [Pseudomonadota bacterium]